jgi:hypothetical protein
MTLPSMHDQGNARDANVEDRNPNDQLLLCQKGCACRLEPLKHQDQGDHGQNGRELRLLEETREQVRSGEADRAKDDPPENLDRPGRVVKLGRMPLTIAYDVLRDSDVCQQFDARTDRVYDQHETEQRR